MDLSPFNYIISPSSMQKCALYIIEYKKCQFMMLSSYLVLYSSYHTVQVNHAGNPPVRGQKLHMTQDRPEQG